MFTILTLRCIRGKMLRTHKTTDLQNAAAAAGRTPRITLVFLRDHERSESDVTQDANDILIIIIISD